MSWAEVKRLINSDKTPLNELLEEKAVETFVQSGTVNSSLQTVLSVEGSGRLHCATVTNKTNSSSQIIITADGEVVCDATVNGTASDYDNVLHIGKIEDVFMIGDGDTVVTPFFTLDISPYATTAGSAILPMSATPKAISCKAKLVRVPLTGAIKFEKSLVVQIKGASSSESDDYGILYDLG